MTDLVVIHPNSGSGTYQDLHKELTAVEPPLWSRLIAGYAIKQGFSVEIIDAEAENLDASVVADRALKAQPLLVAVVIFGHQPSASTQMMPGARRICEALRTNTKYKPAPVIAIGVHVSALPEDSLHYLGCDFVCKGEGPITVAQLLDCFAVQRDGGKTSFSSFNISGLVWHDGVEIVVNTEASLIDIDELGGDVWHMLPMEKYRSHNWQCLDDPSARQPYASIYTSLSCPMLCSFCCIATPFGGSGKGYRLRKPEIVVEEIHKLYTIYGVKTFKIIDEMFVLNAKHVSEICDGLLALGYAHELNIWAYARVDTVKPRLLQKMRAAGIRWLALGIEAGSEQVRDTARKSLKSESIEDIVEQIKLADINVIGNYIFGLPGETRESMEETLRLAQNLNCEFANFYCSMPYPGSQLYFNVCKHPEKLPSDWSGYSQHSYDCLPLATEALSARQIVAFRDKAFRLYFSHPTYLELLRTKFGEQAKNTIEEMMRHSLNRALLRPVALAVGSKAQQAYGRSVEEAVQTLSSAGHDVTDARVFYYSNEENLDAFCARLRTLPALARTRLLYRRPAEDVSDAIYSAVYGDETTAKLMNSTNSS